MSEPRASQIAELWTRQLAGEPLTADENGQLAEALGADMVFRRRVLRDRQLDGALRAIGELRRRGPEMMATMDQLVHAAAHCDGFVERLRPMLAAQAIPPPRWSRRAALGGIALAAVAAGFLGLRLGSPRTGGGRAAPVVAGRVASPRPGDRLAVRPPIRQAVLLVGGDSARLRQSSRQAIGDGPLRARLEQLGFSVRVVAADDEGPPLLDTLGGAQVVVLSPSVATDELNQDLAALPIPLVALESSAFARLGLTGAAWNRDLGNTPGPIRELVITDPGHPLAAGLSGQTTVLARRQRLRWGVPGEDAVVVARYPGAAGAASAIFAYERGSQMPGGPSAARRVGLFLGNGAVVGALTASGWRLFDAAVSWSAADAGPAPAAPSE